MLPGMHDPLVVTERRQGRGSPGAAFMKFGPRAPEATCVMGARIASFSVHFDPLPSAAVTTTISPPRAHPGRLDRLAARDRGPRSGAVLLAWRVLPGPAARLAQGWPGPYGRGRGALG